MGRNATKKKRDLARRFCEAFIRRVRFFLKDKPPEKSPCRSCAFAPKTDSWKGFEATIWELMKAFNGNHPFYCHRNMKTVDGEYKLDPNRRIPCASYEALRRNPAAKTALMEAACEVGDSVPR